MKKRFIAASLAVMILLGALVGCAAKPAEAENAAQPETTEAAINLDLEALYNQGIAVLNEMGGNAPVLFPETDINYLNEFYPGLADIELKQLYAGVAPVTNAPFEVVMVEAANKADVQKVLEIYHARADRESDDTSYPENARAWLNNCKITSRGCYVFLAVLMDPCVVPAEFILD